MKYLKSAADLSLAPLLTGALILGVLCNMLLPPLPPASELYIETRDMWPDGSQSSEAASLAYHTAYDAVHALYAPYDLTRGMIALLASLLSLIAALRCWRFSQVIRLRALPDRLLHLPLFILFCAGFGLALKFDIGQQYDRGAYPPWADSIGIPLFFGAIAIFMLAVVGGLLLWGLVQWMPKTTDTHLFAWNRHYLIDCILWTAGAAYPVYELGGMLHGVVRDGSILGVPTALLGIYLIASTRASIIAALEERKQ